MKARLYILTVLSLLSYHAPGSPTDSLIIQFANKTRVIIHAPDKKGIQLLTGYDLNRIVREMGLKLDSIPNGKTYTIDDHDGKRYLRDTTLIITRRSGSVSVEVRTKNPANRDTIVEHKTVYERVKSRGRSADLKIKTDFLLGLNTWTPQGTSSILANQNGGPELQPLGSRYFAINIYRNPTLVRRRSVRLSLRYGFEIAWNNYMFEENIRAGKGVTQVQFNPVVEPLKKSKLTVTAVQLPVVPQLTFYDADGRKTFHIGIGGFIGYRVDSYTKVKYQNNDTNRDHSSFYLNDLQYGLAANIGLLKTDFFVKYNLNPVFRTNQGPDVHTISFGISL